eukprot:scaffold48_cov311-Pinguiococcus_pyrenoidosus.AAC.95
MHRTHQRMRPSDSEGRDGRGLLFGSRQDSRQPPSFRSLCLASLSEPSLSRTPLLPAFFFS